MGQRVFGWTVQVVNGQPYQVFARRHDGTTWIHQQLVPAFSTDVRAALQVAERLADPAGRRGVELVRDARGYWHARFVRWGRASPRFVAAATLPHAICRAGLAAMDFFAERDAAATAATAAGEPEVLAQETCDA